jgi:hypothetical protein
MQIQMKPNAHPVTSRHYRLTPAEREVLTGKVEEILKRGWIEPSTSAWSSTALFVPKSNGGLQGMANKHIYAYRHIMKETAKNVCLKKTI